MDAAYLESTVAAALVQGLASVVENQPEDSVEFLGKFLIKFADNELALAKVNEGGVGGCVCCPGRTAGAGRVSPSLRHALPGRRRCKAIVSIVTRVLEGTACALSR